jgi:thymidylate synthase
MSTPTHTFVSCIPPGKSQLFLAEKMLHNGVPIQRSTWQGTSAPSPAHELRNVILEFQVPDSLSQWQENCQPDLPWSEEHFQERVSGRALNPTPSYIRWPWHSTTEAERFIREGGRFDHTYPERYWPQDDAWDERRNWGDLKDVVRLLRRDTWTRQAFFPVWFPEDTGATQNQRVPCTLGYQFIRNGSTLDCNYFIRSCDLTRHYKNDIYLTGRLLQWMVENIQDREGFPYPGTLTVFITNLHLFVLDRWRYE